jgi:hypothetical protein
MRMGISLRIPWDATDYSDYDVQRDYGAHRDAAFMKNATTKSVFVQFLAQQASLSHGIPVDSHNKVRFSIR